MMSNVYSKSFLQTSSQIAENSLMLLRDRFLPLLQQAAEQGTKLEVHEINNAFTMDFMSAYLFGNANSTKFSIDPVARRQFMQPYHSRRHYEFYFQEVPSLIHVTKRTGLPIVPKSVDDANEDIEAWGMRMCDGASSYLDEVPSPGAEPVVYKQLKNSMEKHQAKGLDTETTDRMRLEIASEMLDHLGAGHETSAIALTYLHWEMSRHPDLQQKLREEVLTLEPQVLWPPETEGEFNLPSSKSVDGLPLLHAIIMETLRLHAPIPGIEPRVTPAGGCTLAGYDNIPANVRVSAMPYALHRNEEVFPEPEKWDVDRWLQPAESAELKEMVRWFWAFGSGGRMCIGSNLAMQGEIRSLLLKAPSTAMLISCDRNETDCSGHLLQLHDQYRPRRRHRSH
jgi:cytochrome P450